ncbi:Glycoside Hydrolase Family 61 [Rhizoctonia solani]|uniref:lytic cellulose monooxygenase (C4-dehydrogenating) n=1 Tax=Rhizoctonia solani TaxID=456999 RepID=A0A8H7LYB9_9AGAM|nr:Glycoside Hydrolase Family 61 [Rhizoctonia solani]
MLAAQVALGLLSVASSVLAHGFAVELTVSNPPATYTAYNPYQDPYMNPAPERISRKIPGNGPVEDITSTDIQCNGGELFLLVSSPLLRLVPTLASTGRTNGPPLTWARSSLTWPRLLRTLPSGLQEPIWFKIDEAGLENGKWAGTDILLEQNGLWTIIALHAAGSYPGAQFYPACHQFEITGSGSALPDDADLVAFPGAYTPETPGVLERRWLGSGNGGSGAVSSTAAAPSSTAVASSTAAAPSSTAAASSVESEAPSSAPATVPASSEVPEVPASSTVAPVSSTAAPVSSTAAPAPVSSSAAPSTPTGGAGAAQLYAQCGGSNFNGPKGCAAPYICKEWNPYYSQCIQA